MLITRELRGHLLPHRLRAPALGDALAFGTAPSSAFEPSTVCRRALAAWGWREIQSPRESGGPKRTWVRAREDALESIALHECRHTFASLLIVAGLNAKAASTYMGHASVQITYDRYGHLMPGAEEEAAGLLDAYLQRAST